MQMEIQKSSPGWEENTEEADKSLSRIDSKQQSAFLQLMNPKTRPMAAGGWPFTATKVKEEECFDPGVNFVTPNPMQSSQ